ncbi:hypothetical protein T265_14876, partial [Opisthorchis viverrini]
MFRRVRALCTEEGDRRADTRKIWRLFRKNFVKIRGLGLPSDLQDDRNQLWMVHDTASSTSKAPSILQGSKAAL